MIVYTIIPAKDEGQRIGNVLKEAKINAPNILVIDDGSEDDTSEVVENAKVELLSHKINLGKGAALRTGSDYAISKGADTLIYIDSDGQHKPKDIPRLLKALQGADIVFTYRDLSSMQMPLTKKFGNFVLNKLMQILFKISVRDTQSGFKIMTKDAYNKMELISSDYNIESEIVAKTGMKKLKFRQIPIDTTYINRYKGTTVLDGIGIALRMLWWRITS